MSLIFRIKLKEILKERNMTQLELAKVTEIRKAAISEIANNQRTSINRNHLEKIAAALDLKDVGTLFEFVVVDEN